MVRGWLRSVQPVVWSAGIAVVLGGAAGWFVTGHFSIAIGAAALLLAVGIQSFTARRLPACWAWGLLPLYVAGGWVASGWTWHPTLLVTILLYGAALSARARLACAEVAPQTAVALLIGGAYFVLAVGVALGFLPVWSLLAVLALPLGVQAVNLRAGRHVEPAPRLTAFLVVFVGQVVIGMIITGFVR